MNKAPNSIQTQWLVRGTILIVAGLGSLIAVFIYTNWQFYLLGALGGLGIGAWEIWLAFSSMADDEARRLSAPERAANSEEGLRRSGWGSELQPKSGPRKGF